MTAFKSDFLNTLQERGFIHQCSDFDGLDALAAKGQATAYVGYDCTAPSPIWTVNFRSGRCSTVWPWKPTMSISSQLMRFCAVKIATASA